MARHKGDVIAQRKQPLADRADQILVVAAREIRAADRALEQHVAHQGHARRRMHEHHMARRMSGAVIDVENEIPHRHRVAIFQPAVRRETARGRKAVLPRGLRHALDPEGVVAVRPFDGELELFGDILHRTGMIQMPMRDQQFFQRHAAPFGRGQQLLRLATGIHQGATHGFRTPDQRAVLLERRDGVDFGMQAKLRRGCRGGHGAGLARKSPLGNRWLVKGPLSFQAVLSR